MSYPSNRPENSWQSSASASDKPKQMDWQRQQDRDHLNLLTIFYYIMGGIHALYTLGIFAFFAFFGNAVGADMGQQPGPHQDTAAIVAMMLGFGGFSSLISAAFTAATFYAGHCISERKNLTLIQIVAAFHCLSVPFGTALGVFTFVVLGRPTVRDLFDPGYLSRQYEMRR